MPAKDTNDIATVTSRRQLVEYLEQGGKPADHWHIGTEHEKFVFRWSDHAPAPYEGRGGIREFLEAMGSYGWEPILEAGQPIALRRNGASITLEPAGQLELSGEQLKTLHESCREVNTHLREVRSVSESLGVGLIGVGFHPTATREEMPWMPKARYRIMRAYMPTRGNLGLDMMTRTCGVQASLDFADEADMVRKYRLSLALQPIATAIFANSPFVDGKPSGYLSYRAHIWTDTDPDRCGLPHYVFEDGMGFERHVDHALDVPMYFVIRGDRMIDASGQSFRDFLAGKLPALPGEYPTLKDWEDHLTTLFPEVRLKRYIEQRGTDAGPWGRLCALPALWTGLLYDRIALDEAEQVIRGWQPPEMEALLHDVTRHGLKAEIHGRTVQSIARTVLDIARQGLQRRGHLDSSGRDESIYLDEIQEIVETGVTPAEQLLEAYHGRWKHSLDPLFREHCY